MACGIEWLGGGMVVGIMCLCGGIMYHGLVQIRIFFSFLFFLL